MKKIFAALSIALLATTAFAQSGTNSPYSQYGFGVLTDQGNSFNRGMNGVGIAIRPHNQVNYLNPASYSAIDSLTFVFDAGMSLQLTNFKEGKVSKNAKNADFEYAVGAFRVMRNMGLAFGILPYSNIGYSFSNTGTIYRENSSTTTTYTNTYEGSGGIHEVFLGLGYSPINGLSIGANIGYLWGQMDRSVSNSYSDGYVNSLTKTYACSISNYKLDLGLQYHYLLNKEDAVNVGVTYTLGHNLNASPSLSFVSTNSQTSVSDTTDCVAYHGLELPSQIGVGISWMHGTKWNVGIDYTYMNWSKIKYPTDQSTDGVINYTAKTGVFKDRHKINAGAEFCQNTEGRSFFSRIRYRFGASYTTPYLKINGQDGPSEISISGGFGIPIVNAYNNRSMLNVSAQWVHTSAKDLIKENTFRINIGFTFNERWFAKWKFE